MKTCIFIFLPLLLQGANITENISIYFKLIGIPNTVHILGYSKDGHALYGEDCSNDIFNSLNSNKKWKREIGLESYYYHGTFKGYRYSLNPSLNVHAFSSHTFYKKFHVTPTCKSYEIDIDLYCAILTKTLEYI